MTYTIQVENEPANFFDAFRKFASQWQGVKIERAEDAGHKPNALTEKILSECDAGKNMSRAYTDINELMDALDA